MMIMGPEEVDSALGPRLFCGPPAILGISLIVGHKGHFALAPLAPGQFKFSLGPVLRGRKDFESLQ